MSPLSAVRSLFVIVLLATSPAGAQTMLPYPAKVVAMNRDVIASPDGGWSMTTHSEIQILQVQGIPGLKETALVYNSEWQQLQVTEAYIRRPGGQTVTVAPESIVEGETQAARNSPLSAALRQKVIVYPDPQVGDVLVYTATIQSKPVLAGGFFFNVQFPPLLPVDSAGISVTVPKAMTIYVDAHGLTAKRSAAGGNIVYTAQYANATSAPTNLQAVAEFDRSARLTVSNYKDYDALAKAIAAVAAPMLAVSPAVKAKAEEITQGVTDRYQETRLVYDWIANHVRLDDLAFGSAAIAPRSADTVLANGYGDSADQAILFAALLKAKGIDSELAVVNSGDGYAMSEVASLAPFNHVMVWLPEFKLYADPTNGKLVPFGLLQRAEYGKTAMHLTAAGHALHHVPLADGKLSTDEYKLTIRMDDGGNVESESSSTAAGDFAAPLRVLGTMMQNGNGKTLATAILSRNNLAQGTGSFIAAPPDLADSQYRIAATYVPPRVAVQGAALMGMHLGDELQLVKPISPAFYGLVADPRYKDSDPVTCFSGRSTDDETLQFPLTRRVESLPQDAVIKTEHVSYTSHWSQTPTSVNVHREFEARFDQPVCSAWVRDEVQSALARIVHDADASIIVRRN